MSGTRQVVLTGFDVRHLFSHALLWGIASIVEAAGATGVRVRWTEGRRPHPVVSGDDLDGPSLAEAVRDHAAAHGPGSWVDDRLPDEPKRGLFSPRIAPLGEDAEPWHRLLAARAERLDRLTADCSVLDLRMIAAMGQPAWWIRDNKRLAQERGASRLEMQPRNQGSEFVGSRLRPLGEIVGGRETSVIAAGLTGAAVRDQMGKNSSDSRTATNLRPLGPTDDAAAWAALWGLSCAPVAHRANDRTRTATSPGVRGPNAFVLPVWRRPWSTGRLRTVLASGDLAIIRRADADSAARLRARAGLVNAGVDGLIGVPVDVFGSTSAPERRALSGVPVPLDGRMGDGDTDDSAG